MSARSHESITPSNAAILRGWVPFRDDPAGGTAPAPSARYFFTVRQSQPASAAISAYDAPASCRTRNLRMFIQFSGCRIIEEITLRCSRLGSRHNEGWSTSQGRQGTIRQDPGTRSLSEATAHPAPQATTPPQQDRTSKTRHQPRPSRPSHQVVRHPTAEVVRGQAVDGADAGDLVQPVSEPEQEDAQVVAVGGVAAAGQPARGAGRRRAGNQCQLLFDLLVQQGDLGVDRVDQPQVHRDLEGMDVTEPPGQGLCELGAGGPEPLVSQ